jgi:hypothetical protein
MAAWVPPGAEIPLSLRWFAVDQACDFFFPGANMKPLSTLTAVLIACGTLSLSATPVLAAGIGNLSALITRTQMSPKAGISGDRKITFAVNLQFKRVGAGSKADVACVLGDKSGNEAGFALVTPSAPVAGADGSLSGVVNVDIPYTQASAPGLAGWNCEAAAYSGTWPNTAWQSVAVSSPYTQFQ